MSGVIWQRHSLTQKSVRANWNKENWLWFQLPLLTRVSNSRLLFHLNMETNREKHVSPGLFLSQREPRMSSHSHCYSSRNRPAADLIWTERHCCCCCRGHFPLHVCCGTGTLNKIVGPCRAEPSRAEPDDLGELPPGNRSLPALIFISVAGLFGLLPSSRSSAGHQGQPGSIWESVIVFIASFSQLECI